MDFQELLSIGEKAVTEAVRITRKIQDQLLSVESIIKEDFSPVTLADFTVQALICRLLHQYDSSIPVVAEETSEILQKPSCQHTVDKILDILHQEGHAAAFSSKEDLFSSIDLGGCSTAEIFWTLDPIDGTKGFLRGEQYVIALALIAKGEVCLAVIGCPRLSIENDPSSNGYLFLSTCNSPCYRRNLQTGEIREVFVSKRNNPGDMRFVQSYESAHGNLALQVKIAKEMGFSQNPVQMDSQVKYCIVACGLAEVYVRIPNPNRIDYREKIWDHAAGALIVRQAGGIVTDIRGLPLDFSRGKTLVSNRGIVAATPSIHQKIVQFIEKSTASAQLSPEIVR